MFDGAFVRGHTKKGHPRPKTRGGGGKEGPLK